MTDQVQSEIADLALQMEESDDLRRSFALVLERIRTYKQKGMEIPQELARLERTLARECLFESQGR
jgi:hypothetical protein